MNTNRRTFLLATGMTALASRSAFGANQRLRLGVIGAGGRMRALLNAAEASGVDFEIVAVCDVYAPNREQVKTRPSATNATLHNDFHEIVDNKNIDAVLIATPDHWHVRIATAALAAGKDVYLEKPVNHTIEEGEVLRKAVRSSKQILQCGMQQRSWPHFRNAVALIQGGALGRVPQVRTYWWQNYAVSWVPSRSIWRNWTGNSGWVARPISRMTRKNSFAGAGTGTLAAAP